MKKIVYKFADGTTSAIEVSDELYAFYMEMERADRLNERKETRRTQSLERSLDNGWDIEDKDVDIVGGLEECETIDELYAAISKLNPEQKWLIHQVFFERIPQIRIAEQSGVTKEAINNRLTRILRKMKKLLQRCVDLLHFQGY